MVFINAIEHTQMAQQQETTRKAVQHQEHFSTRICHKNVDFIKNLDGMLTPSEGFPRTKQFLRNLVMNSKSPQQKGLFVNVG